SSQPPSGGPYCRSGRIRCLFERSSMTASIIDGKAHAARITNEVATRVRERLAAGKATPGLAVVLVGEHAASMVYVPNKRKITDDVGMRSLSFDLHATTTQPELFALIDRLNADP